jgi:hypothetical protein
VVAGENQLAHRGHLGTVQEMGHGCDPVGVGMETARGPGRMRGTGKRELEMAYVMVVETKELETALCHKLDIEMTVLGTLLVNVAGIELAE